MGRNCSLATCVNSNRPYARFPLTTSNTSIIVELEYELGTPYTPYIGVTWLSGPNDRHAKPWRACVRHQRHLYNLGEYETDEDAARVRDVAALILQGPDANINLDGEPPVGITTEDIRQRLLDIERRRDAK
jgi:hypothetical protein